jgi:phosphoribosylformylglycinamidine cyclo-ligase
MELLVTKSTRPLTYREAGVDIEKGDALVEAIKPLARSTLREGCVGDLGGFGALFEVPKRFRDPILVSGTDGVGTKLKLAIELGRHDSIGIDLVAMCANDVLAQGAEPLFFLDYFATGKLSLATAKSVVAGVAEGCRQAGAALIGGETAEMPGMYAEGDYDLAGFCVGVVERDRILDAAHVAPGDAVIGLGSSGPHSNGYSLIRRIIADRESDLGTTLSGKTLAQHLLAPTRIYVKPILALLDALPVHAAAHITGGGLPGNLVRVLPDGTEARLDQASWEWPPIFDWLRDAGGIESDEMYRTFNCGIGLALVVPGSATAEAVRLLAGAGETVRVIGEIGSSRDRPRVVIDD